MIKFVNRIVDRCPKTGKITKFKINPIIRFLLFPVIGLLAIIWILIRVIPKPSRASYPCMKVAAPIASSFVVYLVGLSSTFVIFKKVRERFAQSQVIVLTCSIALGLFIGTSFLLKTSNLSHATNSNEQQFVDPLGPNQPIGKAKGIFPGRVVWIYDPAATNENYKTTDQNYYLDKNCNQAVVDEMFSKGIKQLTGEATDEAAWNAIFNYFNKTHGKGDKGYSSNETIFIKPNFIHAYGGSVTATKYEDVSTSPQAMLTMLRQLVSKAGVPQANIFVADPLDNIDEYDYAKFHSEFPNINYMTRYNTPNRSRMEKSTTVGIYYSDKKKVLSIDSDYYFTCQMNSDYLINIPCLKGHRWGGVTLFSKNFFGCTTRSGATDLHKGLHRTTYDEPLRDSYREYRVFVDLMGNKNGGGKSLIYFMDGLWCSSYEHLAPNRFLSEPFNNDWASSLFFSLDPVAIESVGLDFLQKEFTEENLTVKPERYTYVQWGAIDDYLHQAADSTWWPEGIQYDPENDGILMKSLGVHEHWNNPIDRQYTRNLGTGNGIELVSITPSTAVKETAAVQSLAEGFALEQNYPNPFNPCTTIAYKLSKPAKVQLTVYNINGQIINTLVQQFQSAGTNSATWNGEGENGNRLPSGIYCYRLQIDDGTRNYQATKSMVMIK
jgi:hypothetical protein